MIKKGQGRVGESRILTFLMNSFLVTCPLNCLGRML